MYFICILLYCLNEASTSKLVQQCIAEITSSMQDLVYIGNQTDILDLALQNLTVLNVNSLDVVENIGESTFVMEDGVIVEKVFSTGVARNVLLVGFNRSSVENLFRISWRYYLTNIVVLCDDLKMYTYYPPEPGHAKYLGTCLKQRLATYKPQMQFKGCRFKTAFYKVPPFQIDWYSSTDPGILVQINKEMQHVLGYSLDVNFDHPHGYGNLDNGKFTGMFGDLHEGKLDYYFGNIMNATYTKYFDFVLLTTDWGIYFWVPKALKTSAWKNLLRNFSGTVWLATIAAFPLVVAASLILRTKETGQFGSLAYCLLTIWKIPFNPNTTMPQSVQLKMLLLIWTYTTYILTSAFQGNITTAFFMYNYDTQIDNNDELLQSNLAHGGSYFTKDIYSSQNTSISRWFLKDFVLTNFSLEGVNRVVKGHFVAVKDAASVIYQWHNYIDRHGEPKLFWFKSDITVFQVIYLRKGHPLTKPMILLQLRFQENSLINHWDKYNRFPKFVQNNTKHLKLTMQHLLIAFVALVLGLATAFILFTFELYLQLPIAF